MAYPMKQLVCAQCGREFIIRMCAYKARMLKSKSRKLVCSKVCSGNQRRGIHEKD